MGRSIKINARELTAQEFADCPNGMESRLRNHRAVIARRQELRKLCELAQRRSLVERAKAWLTEEI